MSWRKYPMKKGEHGPIYNIYKGLTVRLGPDGKWRLYAEKQGRRTNTTFGKGRTALTEAVKAAEAIARQLNPFAIPETAPEKKSKVLKFSVYAKEWLHNNSGRWHYNTCKRYEGIIDIHILSDSEFKVMPLDQIDRQKVRRLLLKVYKNRSPATVELVHTVIHGIFNDAIEDGIVEGNPATGLLKKILPPINQRDEKEPEPLDLKERDVFLDYAEKKFSLADQLMLKMMLFAGLRLGEILAMRLRHFDYNKMTYHITESYKQYLFSKPKFGKKRIVDLPDFLMEELKAYITYLKKVNFQQGKGGEIDLLFLDPKEHMQWPYSQRKIQALVKKICKGTGMRHRNPHDLRHTYATIMLMAHQSPAYVQKQLGHSSISITVDTYGHWISGEGRFELENALLGVYGNRTKSHIK